VARLDLTPLVNATDRLREGLARHLSEPTDEQLRDGLIHRFELTYELGHRVLRRFLRDNSATPEDIDRLPFQDLIRTANQQGLLLGDWPAWRRFREMRARSSHAYPPMSPGS
jgi:nucleotidyltransferase substrate binding protein (TIGR01987 family)